MLIVDTSYHIFFMHAISFINAKKYSKVITLYFMFLCMLMIKITISKKIDTTQKSFANNYTNIYKYQV